MIGAHHQLAAGFAGRVGAVGQKAIVFEGVSDFDIAVDFIG